MLFLQGFLLVPDFFERRELEPVIVAICELVDQLAEKLYNAGKIKGKYQHNSHMMAWYLNLKSATYTQTHPQTTISAYEVKNNCCLFEKPFKV